MISAAAITAAIAGPWRGLSGQRAVPPLRRTRSGILSFMAHSFICVAVDSDASRLGAARRGCIRRPHLPEFVALSRAANKEEAVPSVARGYRTRRVACRPAHQPEPGTA